jgi:hypothetical protein
MFQIVSGREEIIWPIRKSKSDQNLLKHVQLIESEADLIIGNCNANALHSHFWDVAPRTYDEVSRPKSGTFSFTFSPDVFLMNKSRPLKVLIWQQIKENVILLNMRLDIPEIIPLDVQWLIVQCWAESPDAKL